jgi:hypothetical protein
MKNNWLFLLLVPLFWTCEQAEEKNVATALEVYNEVYDKNQEAFSGIIEQLQNLVKENNFELGTYDIENLEPEEIVSVTSLLQTEEVLLKSKISSYSILVIYDDFLSVLKTKERKEKDQSLSNYNMAFLRGSDFSFLTASRSPYGYLLKRKKQGTWDSIVTKDSISYNEKIRKERSIQRDIDKLKNLNYVLLIDDLFVMDSKRLSNNSFESGSIVMLTKLINLKSKKVETQKVFLIENSDEIKVATGGSEAFEKMNLRMDIMAKKVEQLNQFYKFN